jgi:hypothetical protein
MTRPTEHRLTLHRCKHCGQVLAHIDERARQQRFALWCWNCGAHLVLRPAVKRDEYEVARASV